MADTEVVQCTLYCTLYSVHLLVQCTSHRRRIYTGCYKEKDEFILFFQSSCMVQNSQCDKEFNKFCPPNSSDDLSLLVCILYIHPSSVVRVHRGQQEVYRSDTKHLLYSEQCTQYCKQKVYSTNNSNCLPMKKQLNCLWSYNCLQNGVHLIEIDMRYLHQYMLLAAGRMNF